MQQGFDATLFDCLLVTVESVSRQTHDLAGFRLVAKFFGRIQQTNLVFDDLLVSMKQEGDLFGFDGLVDTSI